MATRGKYHALCCVDDSVTIVNEFLTTAYSAVNGDPALIIISSLDQKYTEPTQLPVDPFSAPFTGKNTSECAQLIREMTARTESDLNYEFLVILDERSSQDKTAMVVKSSDPYAEPRTLRAEFKIVNVVLLSCTGKGLFNEYKEIADGSSDGVLRFDVRLMPEASVESQPVSNGRTQLKRRE